MTKHTRITTTVRVTDEMKHTLKKEELAYFVRTKIKDSLAQELYKLAGDTAKAEEDKYKGETVISCTLWVTADDPDAEEEWADSLCYTVAAGTAAGGPGTILCVREEDEKGYKVPRLYTAREYFKWLKK